MSIGAQQTGPVRELLLLDDSTRFAGIAPAWRRLEALADQPAFFQSLAWCGHVAETMANAHPATYRPLVAVSLRDGEPVAIWPLSRQRSLGMWSLRNLDEPFGQFAGLLAEDEFEAQELVRMTLEAVRQKRLASSAKFERVIEGSALDRALRGIGTYAAERTAAPVIDLAAFVDHAELLASRNKKTLKNLRNATNRLTKTGVPKSSTITPGAGLDRLIALTLANREAWLEQNGITSPSFRRSCHAAILTGGAPWGLNGMRLGFELELDGRSIAQQWGFVHDGRYYAYMSGTDLAMSELSPGRLHLAKVIEAGFDQGLRALELLTPASPYKMTWTDTVRTLGDVTVELSTLGRTRQWLWEQRLRPSLKAGYYSLPAALRRKIPI